MAVTTTVACVNELPTASLPPAKYHIISPMKRSAILYWIILGMIAVLVLVVIAVPQSVLDYYEIYFMMIYMPILAFLWFRAYLDGIRGN
jgi:hypothetical protein